MTTAAEIAARYGAIVAPGLVVQQIPRGASGLPQFQWDGRTLVTKENAAIPQGQRKTGAEAQKAARSRAVQANKRKAALRRAAQRDTVLELHAQGLTPHQMEHHGVKHDVARDVLTAAGMEPHRVAPRSEIMAQNTALVEAVRQCAAEGLGITPTAKRLNIGERAVEYIREKHGIARAEKPRAPKEAKPRKPRPQGNQVERDRVALCEAIKADAAAGLGWHDICAKHGLSTHNLGMLNRHRGLGLTCPPRKRKSEKRPAAVKPAPVSADCLSLRARKAAARAARQEKHAAIIRIRAEGRSIGRIAEDLGIPFGTVRGFLARKGIKVDPSQRKPQLDKRIHRHGVMAAQIDAQTARRESIRAIAAAGPLPTQRELSERFRCGLSTIQKDLSEMGLVGAPSKPRGAFLLGDQIVAMQLSGAKISEIVAATGASKSAIFRVLKRARDEVEA